MNFDFSADDPELNPGVELPYELALPTYAATAWYHHKLPEAQRICGPAGGGRAFAMSEYAQALVAGSSAPAEQRQAIAAKLHQYTGLPVEYILKADLRMNGGEFEKNLEDDSDTTTGRWTRGFPGPRWIR